MTAQSHGSDWEAVVKELREQLAEVRDVCTRRVEDLEAAVQRDLSQVSSMLKDLKDKNTNQGKSTTSGVEIMQVTVRVDQIEAQTSKLAEEFGSVKERVDVLLSQNTVAVITGLSRKILELTKGFESFKQHTQDSLFTIRKREMARVVSIFRTRWETMYRQQDAEVLKFSFGAWRDHGNHCRTARRGYHQLELMLLERSAGARYRRWWYTTQRDRHKRDFERLTDFTSSVHVQLGQVLTRMTKREKVTQDSLVEINGKVEDLEVKTVSLTTKKAGKQELVDAVANLEEKFSEKFDTSSLSAAVQLLRKDVDPIKSTFIGRADFAKLENRFSDHSAKVQIQFEGVDRHLAERATKIDISRKAESSRVEQVLMLVAKQMDAIARANVQDFDTLRGVLLQFLKLSPDLRKAALSQGINPNDRCMSCRTGGDFPVQIRGTNDRFFKVDVADTTHAAPESLKDKLRAEGQLKSNIDKCGEVKDRSADTVKIRDLLNQGAAWLSGGVGTGSATASRPSTAPQSRPRVAVRSFFPAVPDPSGSQSRVPSARSAGSSRQPVRPTSARGGVTAPRRGSRGQVLSIPGPSAEVDDFVQEDDEPSSEGQ
mmetsp:Transcript_71593/g.190978  ORF Transcript_71593/g.190978 Transcript_71593/m.190978 type:complete len:598 (-) Transcript_71593:80-1873(-)